MIKILDHSFNPAEQLSAFEKTCGDAGAVVAFLGRVRAENDIRELSLQAYPGVTENGIADALKDAETRWSLTSVHIIHRVGAMQVGEPIVQVLTAAIHRRDAFEACDFLMDYLKTKAIFWKKQTGPDGDEWIEPRPEDYKDNERWSKP